MTNLILIRSWRSLSYQVKFGQSFLCSKLILLSTFRFVCILPLTSFSIVALLYKNVTLVHFYLDAVIFYLYLLFNKLIIMWTYEHPMNLAYCGMLLKVMCLDGKDITGCHIDKSVRKFLSLMLLRNSENFKFLLACTILVFLNCWANDRVWSLN